jgi:hypothetical protein
MLMNKPGDIPYSEITPKRLYMNCRKFLAPRPLLAWHGIDESNTYTNPTMLRASVTLRPQQNQMGLAPHRLRGPSTSSWLRRVESMIQYTYLQISFR